MQEKTNIDIKLLLEIIDILKYCYYEDKKILKRTKGAFKYFGEDVINEIEREKRIKKIKRIIKNIRNEKNYKKSER